MQSNNIDEMDVEKNVKIKQNSGNKLTKCLRTNLLTLLTIVGVIGGAGLGFILRSSSDDKWSEREIMYVNFVGDIFLRMLKSLILPLIVSSLISAIANLDLSLSGKIATKAILYYLITTILAIILGIILVITIRPGDSSIEHQNDAEVSRNVTTVDTLLDMVRNMFPPNLMEACIRQFKTVLIPSTSSEDILDWKLTEEYVDGTNILGLVVFSAILGVTLARLGDEGKPLANFFTSLMTSMMKITSLVIWFSPVGIFFLVAAKILEVDDFSEMIGQLGLYFVTVLVGVLLHGFVTLPLIFFVFTRKSPITYALNMAQAMATAFGTASSSATLPVTIQCLEDNNNIDPRVTRFILPIGSTINMDGTALYEAVAAIFIAQTRGITLSIGNIIAISITATAASIGAAGIPQAGLVTMVMVLDTVGLPAGDVSLILAVDWLLDRFRTTINVIGDAYGAGIVDHLSKDDLTSLTKNPVDEQQINSDS